MKGHVALVGIIAFVAFSAITLIISPTLPPESALYNVLNDFFEIPEITYSYFGFSGEVIVHGLLNGVSWGLLIAIIYYFGKRSSKREVFVVPVSARAPVIKPTPQPIHTPVFTRTLNQQPTINFSREVKPITKYVSTYVPLDKSIQMINGIGPKYSNMFRFHGVEDLNDLLREGATAKSRRHLAANIGVSLNKINRWVNQADFFRIKGIGKQYADLLDVVGVNTVVDLSNRNPMALYSKIKETNWNKNLVDREPPLKMIQNWVESAKRLEPRVS